jgi:hypothetical protein
MPHQRKTRTKFTDEAEPRHIRRTRQIRLEVAAEAARILATEGQQNYHVAKKKAAERIGVSERLALPSNVEVKDALRTYQALYGGPAHRENIDNLRRIALQAMHLLEVFRPRLVGSVLDGTASAHSRIALHVFADQEQRQIRWFNGEHRTVPIAVFKLEDVEIELTVFDLLHLRQSPPSPIDGRPQRRAGLAEVEYLLGSA